MMQVLYHWLRNSQKKFDSLNVRSFDVVNILKDSHKVLFFIVAS